MYYTVCKNVVLGSRSLCLLCLRAWERAQRWTKWNVFFILVIVYILKSIVGLLIVCFPIYFQSNLGVLYLSEKTAVFQIYQFSWCAGAQRPVRILNTEQVAKIHVAQLYLHSSHGPTVLSFINYFLCYICHYQFFSSLYSQTLLGDGQGTTHEKGATPFFLSAVFFLAQMQTCRWRWATFLSWSRSWSVK